MASQLSYHFRDSSSSDEGVDDEVVNRLMELKKEKKGSKLKKIFNTRPLSVQSGDIVRSTTPRRAAVDPQVPSSRNPAFQLTQGLQSAGSSVEEECENDTRQALHRGGCYDVLYTIVLKAVNLFFYSKKCRGCVIPLASLGFLAGNLVTIGLLVVVSMTKFPPQINRNIEAFRIPSHPSQLHYDAYLAARANHFNNDSQQSNYDSSNGGNLLKRKRRSSSSEGLLLPRSTSPRNSFPNCASVEGTQRRRHRYWMLDLVFRAPASNPDKNILTLDRIRYIHKVEETLQNTTDYQYFCLKSNGYLCDPLVSLLTWFYVRDHVTGKYVSYTPDSPSYDLKEVISQNKLKALWFTGTGLTIKNSTYSAELLRSQLRIGVPLRCFSYTSSLKEQEGLVTNYLISLIPILEEMSNSDIEILYGGSNIFDYEFTSAVKHDAILASISGFLILLLVFVLTGCSLWLTFGGLYAIVSCFMPTYFIYRIIFGIQSVGILNVISIFVIIGIGVDDVFVFINTFKQSARFKDLDSPEKRITHTILEATKATFFTSLTTSIAFFANAISSIPAIQQFGIFMGLVVLLCFLQVFLVIPHFLFVWHHAILPLENCLFFPLRKCLQLVCKCGGGALRKCLQLVCKCGGGDSVEVSVRMSDIAEHGRDVDSGISSTTNSDNSSDGSSQLEQEDSKEGHDFPGLENGVASEDSQNSPHSLRRTEDSDNNLSPFMIFLQEVMFWISVAAVILHVWAAAGIKKAMKVKVIVNVLACCLGYVILLAIAIHLVSNLRPSDKPPQFFSPNSNLQKMLDLIGNVTEGDVVDGYSLSEQSSSSSSIPIPPPGPGTESPGGHGNSGNGGNSGGSSSSTTRAPARRPTTQPQTAPPNTPTVPPHRSTTTKATPPATTAAPHQPQTPPRPQTHSAPPTLFPPTTSAKAPPINSPSPPPATHSTDSGLVPSQGPGSSKYVNNAVVYVVLGVERVKRYYDPAHVLPEEGEQVSAVLDHTFSNVFSCIGSPSSQGYSPSDPNKLRGAVRALCRLCSNISNPANGLVLNGNYECFPSVGQNTPSYSLLSCILAVAADLQECEHVFSKYVSDHSGTTNSVSVHALASVTNPSDTVQTNKLLQLQYLTMAFRSTTNLGNSPLSSLKDYNRWETFLSSELQAIKDSSSSGQDYDGAEATFSAFQASEYWVRVNLENAAVSGSIYGIIVSFILCSIIVVFLSHDYRLVLSMFVTIVAILLTLCGFFYCFGWTLGIVEAISLSILVGNSLDYCIHLSEAFISMDGRHIAFVESFKISKGLSTRVKKVMAAISFIGVSICSSAITTILAILPLLGTEIQLFTRFGQILLLDTAVTIVFTLVICGNCLAFFGPEKPESRTKKVVNGVVTISVTIIAYGVLFLGLFIASKNGVHIPSPQGYQLF